MNRNFRAGGWALHGSCGTDHGRPVGDADAGDVRHPANIGRLPRCDRSSTTTPTTMPGCPTCWPGRTMDEAGADKFDGDLLGADPVASFAAIVETSPVRRRAAVRDLDQVAHLSFGDYSVREYLWQINFFRGVRAHEIARVIGSDPTLPPELVQGLWDEVSPNAEEWRTIGVFGPAVAVPVTPR